MSRHGKLVGDAIVEAPRQVRVGNTYYTKPTDEQYLAAVNGPWKVVVDEKPAAREGYEVKADGWEETDTAITRKWIEVEKARPSVPEPVQGPRVFSVPELFWWVAQHGKTEALDDFLKSQGLYSVALTQTEVSGDDPNFTTVLGAIQDALELTDREIDECLTAAEV